jgi:hypothetical protein
MHTSRRSRLASYKENTTPADTTFCQLCVDIVMAKDVTQKIRSGLVNPEHLDDVKELERCAWLHMVNYIAAKAFVDDENDEPRSARLPRR